MAVHAGPRVGLAACFHETNTFASTLTDQDAFRRRNGWLPGQRLVDAFRGTRTVVGGMLDGAARTGLTVAPTFGAYATPAGVVSAATFETIIGETTDGLGRAGPLDGLLLELHGAMVVEGENDPEAVLLDAIRTAIGDLPLAAVVDLHANMTADRLAFLDVLVGYRTNPHVDTHERGHDAVTHLAALLRGDLRTTIAHRAVPVLAAPIAQRTSDPPLEGLLATARQLEHRHRLVDVTVHAGYAYADVPHAGMSFTATAPTGRRAQAEEAVEKLAAQAWHDRHQFAVTLSDDQDAIDRALTTGRRGRPTAVADTGDNINGGAPGDATWLLTAALAQTSDPVAATLCDPAAVATLESMEVGAVTELELGGRASPLSGPPIQARARLRWIGDGTFVNQGPMAQGASVTMGRTAVVTVGNVDLVLQSLPVQPNDPELFRSVGLDPADYALVLLKGAAALRAGWAPLVTGFVDAGTPGLTDCLLERLPYRRADRAWPLRPDATRQDDT